MSRQRQYKIRLPMRLQTSSKKKTALNLNVYRNLHFRSLSSLKNKFHKLTKKLLQDVPPLGRITLLYEVYPQTKRLLDIGNVCSIVDKFFSDSLTTYGIIEDDNHKYLDEVTFRYGGLSPIEHVLVTITEIEPRKDSTMRVLLDHIEIQTALDTYVSGLGISGSTGVVLKADSDGFVSAEVQFGVDTSSVGSITEDEGEPSTTRARRRTKAEMAAARAEEESSEDVAGTTETGGSTDSSGSPDTSDDKDEDAVNTKTETPKGKASKNLFSESPEESSKINSGSEQKEESVDQPKKVVKSIFDQ